MDIKLIAVDMDGTLLNGKNEIDQRTIDVLQKMIDRGVYVVPATGRCPGVFPKDLFRLNGLAYAVAENGALIWNMKTGEAMERIGLPLHVVKEAVEMADRCRSCSEVFVNGQAYSDSRCREWAENPGHDENFVRYFRENHQWVDQLSEQTELLSQAEKVNLYFELEQDGTDAKAYFGQNPSLSALTSVGRNVEITMAEADKGRGLESLMEHLHISREQVVAFGDQENDLGMLKTAGIGVAMGNAVPAVKQAADYETLSNDEDGVACFLEKIVLLRFNETV
ncbi:MAG: Cof-type HAD-IIB family hydrolase [Eubacteriales bacterium]|nr:Cof-type HAD-IIB family hydrolase [Eubacteriales bacterium]